MEVIDDGSASGSTALATPAVSLVAVARTADGPGVLSPVRRERPTDVDLVPGEPAARVTPDVPLVAVWRDQLALCCHCSLLFAAEGPDAPASGDGASGLPDLCYAAGVACAALWGSSAGFLGRVRPTGGKSVA
jgi:hypothetical protein